MSERNRSRRSDRHKKGVSISLDRRLIDEVSKIAKEEERSFSDTLGRLARKGLEEKKTNSDGL